MTKRKRRPLSIKIPQYIRLLRDEIRGYFSLNGVVIPLDRKVISYRIRKAISRGDYEKDELELGLGHINSTSRILELGGGVGYVSARIQKHCLGAHVTSFEANPDAAALYCRTMSMNGLSNFKLHNAILGSAEESSTRIFHIAQEFWASSTVSSGGATRSIEVEVVDVAAFLRGESFDILIADIEGGEADLVDLLEVPHFKIIVMEIHHDVIGAAKTERMLAKLNELGYELTSSNVEDRQSVCMFELRVSP